MIEQGAIQTDRRCACFAEEEKELGRDVGSDYAEDCTRDTHVAVEGSVVVA
jgi:hypothetical protein